MTEAVIVATARSPIGRAFKGSLTSIRPDDLTRQMVRRGPGQGARSWTRPTSATSCSAAGCPAASRASTWRRVVAVMLGFDHLPGTTVTRYCSSSLQTTRMAFHAIKAGEGDVFISAGVECVSRFTKGSSDSWPDTKNPVFAGAEARTAGTVRRRACATWHDPARRRRGARHLHRHGADRRERRRSCAGSAAAEQDEFGVRSQNLAEKALANGFWQRDITPATLPDGTVVGRRRRPPAGHHAGQGGRAEAGVPPGRDGHRRATAARSTTAPPQWWS